VGAGALGTALAHAFTAAGVRVAAIASRSPDRAKALAAKVPGARAITLGEAGSAAPTVLLAVSDSAIEEACNAVQAATGTLVAHTSGSRDTQPLEAARALGAQTGGFHPLAAVTRWRDASEPNGTNCAVIFRGAAFAVEGNRDAQSRLVALAEALGGRPFAIAGADKPLYHLGASMLAAFSAGLAQIAWDQMRSAGADAALASAGVGHLLRTVADNIARAGTPAEALTGPVARGDAEGVRRQEMTARGLSREVRGLYHVHVVHNILLAKGAGRISDQAAAQMLAALGDDEKTSGRDHT
jgi:predicted short-subunit dehydrogenase-like oxidoreductase (DUF2520 family)